MEAQRLPASAGAVRLLRAALAAGLLAAGCMYLPASVRPAAPLAAVFADLVVGLYAFLRAECARYAVGEKLVELRSGVFWKQTTVLRRRDIQTVRLCRTPLLELFGLTAVILCLPGHTYWLDGVPEQTAEALL